MTKLYARFHPKKNSRPLFMSLTHIISYRSNKSREMKLCDFNCSILSKKEINENEKSLSLKIQWKLKLKQKDFNFELQLIFYRLILSQQLIAATHDSTESTYQVSSLKHAMMKKKIKKKTELTHTHLERLCFWLMRVSEFSEIFRARRRKRKKRKKKN